MNRRTLLRGAAIAAAGLSGSGALGNTSLCDTEEGAWLDACLNDVRKRHDLAAISAFVVKDGALAAHQAVGIRKYGAEASTVMMDDPFHLGSCTKAMTATLCAMLVEQNKLNWSTTLADIYPELVGKMQKQYATVTIDMLLSQKTGFSDKSWLKGKTVQDMYLLPGDAKSQRSLYSAAVLCEEPVNSDTFLYSNRNYILAGSIVEKITGKAWESYIREKLFLPLKMVTAGFGSMGTPGKIDAPWQHTMVGKVHIPVEPGPRADNPPVVGPAGRVHCSAPDWSRFIVEHLNGAMGKSGLLKPETYQHLHTPGKGDQYYGGWMVTERPWSKGSALVHNGSNTMNYCIVWIAPARNFAVGVCTNQFGNTEPAACDEVAVEAIKRVLA